jgi:integrase
VTKKTGKGGYAREIPVSRSTWDAFLAYRKAYGFESVPAENDGTPLVLSVRTKAVEIAGKEIKNSASRRFFGAWRAIETRQGLYAIVKDRLRSTAAVLRDAGELRSAERLESASPHWLRHTFGKATLLAGSTLRETAAALGHNNDETVFRYSHQAALDLIEAWERENPGAVARDVCVPCDDGIGMV